MATGTGAAPSGAIDLGDALLAPGFVDLQVNGTDDVDFATASVDEIVGAVDRLAAGGCTGCLPTVCSAPLDAYAAILDRLAAVRAARPDAVLGVHLEGPFLGGAPGAHPVELLRPVELEWLVALCDRFGDLIRLVTLAPEADPGLRAVAALRDRGVVVALGHSTVDYDVRVRGRRRRRRPSRRISSTAWGRCTTARPAFPAPRSTYRPLVPSIIADGVHVHPAMVRLALARAPGRGARDRRGRDGRAGDRARRRGVHARRHARGLDAHDARRGAARRRARCRRSRPRFATRPAIPRP